MLPDSTRLQCTVTVLAEVSTVEHAFDLLHAVVEAVLDHRGTLCIVFFTRCYTIFNNRINHFYNFSVLHLQFLRTRTSFGAIQSNYAVQRTAPNSVRYAEYGASVRY